jgi:restriction endonuclease S subunit
MKLRDIAEVKTGLVLARKEAELDNAYFEKYKQLNLKCIQDDGDIDLEALDVFLSVEKLGDNYLTCPGDVIVRLSAPYTAVLIAEETQGLVVSSHFCIIRIKEGKGVPEYIKWLLNSHMVKSQIAKNTTGITYASIKPSFYSELEIKLLTLEEQKEIAWIYSMGQKELALLDELKSNKERLYKTILTNLYNKKRR